jgi:hypothetical protein
MSYYSPVSCSVCWDGASEKDRRCGPRLGAAWQGRRATKSWTISGPESSSPSTIGHGT